MNPIDIANSLKNALIRLLESHFTDRSGGHCALPLMKIFHLNALIPEDGSFYVFVSSDTESLSWKVQNALFGSLWSHAGVVRSVADHLWAYHIKAGELRHEHLLEVLRCSDNFALVKMKIGRNAKKIEDRLETLKASKTLKHTSAEFVMALFTGYNDNFEPQGKPFSPDDVYAGGEIVYQYILKSKYLPEDYLDRLNLKKKS